MSKGKISRRRYKSNRKSRRINKRYSNKRKVSNKKIGGSHVTHAALMEKVHRLESIVAAQAEHLEVLEAEAEAGGSTSQEEMAEHMRVGYKNLPVSDDTKKNLMKMDKEIARIEAKINKKSKEKAAVAESNEVPVLISRLRVESDKDSVPLEKGDPIYIHFHNDTSYDYALQYYSDGFPSEEKFFVKSRQTSVRWKTYNNTKWVATRWTLPETNLLYFTAKKEKGNKQKIIIY